MPLGLPGRPHLQIPSVTLAAGMPGDLLGQVAVAAGKIEMAPQAAVKWADVLVAVNGLVARPSGSWDALHQSVIGMPNEVEEMTTRPSA